jgi:hypothetical protein
MGLNEESFFHHEGHEAHEERKNISLTISVCYSCFSWFNFIMFLRVWRIGFSHQKIYFIWKISNISLRACCLWQKNR